MHEPKFKDSKVVHAHLAQKGKCLTWNQRFMRGPGTPLRVTFGHWTFLFSRRKACQYWHYCRLRLICEKPEYWQSCIVERFCTNLFDIWDNLLINYYTYFKKSDKSH